MHADTELDSEFPERFQMHVSRLFPDSTLILNTNTSYADAVVHSSAVVEPTTAKRFYRELLDFCVQVKKPLLQCLQECSVEAGNCSNWVIVLARLPPLFCDWWVGQLSMLREMGVQVTVHVLLLIDPLPCAWGAILRLRGSRLDAPRLDAFRGASTLFEPSVLTK